jgi:hypothetical protein
MGGEIRQAEIDRLDEGIDIELRDIFGRSIFGCFDQERAGAFEVPADPRRVAADVVDVGGGDLDRPCRSARSARSSVPIQAGSRSSCASK